MPVKPHSSPGSAPTSRRSTTRMSPGSAPSTWIGPESTWTTDSLTTSMSAGLSLFLIWPSVQSLHSMRKTSPGFTITLAGMSGCQRLWPTSSCLDIGFVRSTLNSVFGIVEPPPGLSLYGKQSLHPGHVHVVAAALVDHPAAVQHQQPIGDLQREAQDLFGDDDGQPLLIADDLQDLRQLLDDRRL